MSDNSLHLRTMGIILLDMELTRRNAVVLAFESDDVMLPPGLSAVQMLDDTILQSKHTSIPARV